MSESERLASVLRTATNMAVSALLVYAAYVILAKYQSRHPWLKTVVWVMTTAAQITVLAGLAYFMVEAGYTIRVSLPLFFVILLELSPNRWREGYWNDFSLRAISVAACCFSISEILFAWWQ